MKVNILGMEYEILVRTIKENKKLDGCTGLCEQYSKEIILLDSREIQKDEMCVSNVDDFMKTVLRHEIIHAFLGESGLRGNSDWAENEEIVDWIAIQFPKMCSAMLSVDAI